MSDSYYYRKIFKQHFGVIPIDEEGRTYEIHHIDGNHKNNEPSNLKAVSLQEHYDIHYKQGDWAACHRISKRLNKTKEEISELARLLNIEKVKKGTHQFLGGGIQRKRVMEGTHNFLGKNNPPAKRMLEMGIHPFQGEQGSKLSSITNAKRIENKTHNFLGDGSMQREIQKKRLENGTHHFLLPRETVICPHCDKSGPKPQMIQWHFDNCKGKKNG